MEYLLSSISDWEKVAKKIAPRLRGGMILTISGPLGAGKTTFVQALARTLGARSIPRSPTFSLVRHYRLPSTVYRLSRLLHVDAYRLEKPEDLLPLDLDDALDEAGTIIVMEWPENAASWIKKQKHVLRMKIVVQKNGTRSVTLAL